MYIGHFVGAEILQNLVPTSPRWVALVGVSFPDLLWGVTVLTGAENVEIAPDSPLQKYIKFIKYPFSHSLVLTNLLACIPAAIIASIFGLPAGLVFLAASVSHWILDTIVHLPDLPVLGFDGDRKVGLGLWRYGKTAWLVECAFFAVGTLLFVPQSSWAYVLVVGLILHSINLNSSFGLTKKNPFKSGKIYAVFTLVGFAAAIFLFHSTL